MKAKNYIVLLSISLVLLLNIPISKARTSEIGHAELSYREYVAFDFTASEENTIEWKYESSNPNVTIVPKAMPLDEYLDFRESESYSFYNLSNGNLIEDEGSFEPPERDIWVIVFHNTGPANSSTTLDYFTELEKTPSETFEVPAILVLSILLLSTGLITGIIIKRKKSHVDDSPPEAPITKKTIQKFRSCSYCGEIIELTIKNCQFCGNLNWKKKEG